MNITCDSTHRSLYLKLKPGGSVESLEVAPRIVFDYDADGQVIGIDIDDAEQSLDVELARRLSA